VASFFPFQTTYYLNGHSFIEQELNRAQIGFRKNDNAFLAALASTRARCKSPPPPTFATSGHQGGPFTPSSFSYSLSAVMGSLKYSRRARRAAAASVLFTGTKTGE
jgi:hypothetical protein